MNMGTIKNELETMQVVDDAFYRAIGEAPVVVDEVIPSQASEGIGSEEGVETSSDLPKENCHERPEDSNLEPYEIVPASLETGSVGINSRLQDHVYDSLIRVDGSVNLGTGNSGVFGAIAARSQMFVRQGADISISNLTTGGFFPSDQTFVTLAVRVWTYFRVNMEMITPNPNTGNNNLPGGTAGSPIGLNGAAIGDRVMRVHKLYHQAENQLFWQLTAGDKPQLTHFTAYTPMAGGLDGFFSDSHLPRANNGVPTSSALMRLARPVLIPPRQGFNVVAIISAMGTAVGASLIDQLNGQAANAIGLANTANAADSIEKDLKYLFIGVPAQ